MTNKLAEIKYYIYRNKPDLVCLCETMVKKHEPKFIGYNVLWKHRDGDKGGLAILVRHDISFKEVDFNEFQGGGLELQIIEFAGQGGTIRLANIYNPNQNILVPEFNHYLDILGNRCILIGDFNAHSPLWDSRARSNSTGRNIERILESRNLEILNEIELPTYIDNTTGRTSCLDLCIASPEITNRAEFNRGQDMGSDHFPIEISIGIPLFKSDMKSISRWKLQKVEWTKWKENLCKESDYILPMDTVSHNKKLTDKILSASNAVIPKSKTDKSLKRCTPWWDQECKNAVNSRNAAKNLLIRHPLITNLINYKRCQARVKFLIKKKKTESWRNFTSTLQSNTPSKKIWNIIKSINGKQPKKNLPFGDYNLTDKDKANLLLDQFTMNRNHEQRHQEPLPIIPERIEDPYIDIKEYEILECISKVKNTTPGADNICNAFLKKVPYCIIQELLQLFNSSLVTSVVPDEWKSGVICAIPKPGKDPSLVTSYRPITMLSCVGKLLERILKRRLEFFLETNNVFPATQTGFRKCRSTVDCLSTLKHMIMDSFSQKKYCVVAYLDLQSAYDCVWHDGLLFKLKSLQVNSHLINWIRNYLNDRKVNVRIGLHLSEERILDKGLPQGAVLSPILFNVMLHDIPKSDNVKVISYADDISLVCMSENLNEAQYHMQHYLNTLTSWLTRWKFILNPQKCSYQIFTKKRNVPNLTLLISNQNIEQCENQRVLGVIFDAPKLTFKEHVIYLKTECTRRLSVLRSISSNRWGASRNLLRRVYISYIRSKLEYGCVVFGEISSSLIKKLDVVQNSALRTILGARKTSPVLSLEVESYIMPLDIRFKFLFIKWYCKMMYSPKNGTGSEIGQEVGVTSNNINVSANERRADNIMNSLGLNKIRRVSTPYISPVPPHIDLTSRIAFDMFEGENDIIQNVIKKTRFTARKEEIYRDFIEIYTDGSKLEDGSTSAAMYLPHQEKVTSWKINPQHSVLGSELYAIFKAVQFVASKPVLQNHNIIIFTDSKSALHIIANTFDPSYKSITFQIQKFLLNLGERVKLQWVRGHIGVVGNEIADRGANLGHTNSFSALTDLNFNEVLKLVKERCFKLWIRLWKERVTVTQKGEFMSEHQAEPVFRPWLSLNCRLYETASARLRIGHFGLNSHMNRFEMRESSECEFCGVNETIHHFLFDCEQYSENRNEMRAALSDLDVNFEISNLMLGGDFSCKIQIKIHKIVIKYLIQSGRIRNF